MFLCTITTSFTKTTAAAGYQNFSLLCFQCTSKSTSHCAIWLPPTKRWVEKLKVNGQVSAIWKKIDVSRTDKVK